ncbi:resuscitation-promoting factor [Xylanimonas oleitrophica]|uniref:Resuscitation-promoting factor n=2 Tax=Xylanimonas oleitrophica TaxID=2607479 RepID=A0A2W5WTD3_9MICO|nr:resuscitation-promoting factor [Xylanimonas oleitrophica]
MPARRAAHLGPARPSSPGEGSPLSRGRHLVVGTVQAPEIEVLVSPPATPGAVVSPWARTGARRARGEERTGRRRRRAPLVAALTAAAVVAGGAVAYGSARKTITLDVDGNVTQVTTLAGSVEGLLRAEGVRVGDRDAVAPAVESPLRDGAEVVVRYGRLVTLLADGAQSDVWVTALDANEALSRLSARGDDVRLVASRSGDRLSLPLRLVADGGPVAVVADGEARATRDAGAGLDSLLESVDVDVDADDRVSVLDAADVEHVAGVSAVEAGGAAPQVALLVQRVEVQDVEEITPLPFERVEQEDPDRFSDLPPRVTQQGVEGAHTKVFRVTTVDGVEESRELVSEGDTTPPVDEVVVTGTKERPAETSRAQAAPQQESRSGSASGPASSAPSAGAPAAGAEVQDGPADAAAPEGAAPEAAPAPAPAAPTDDVWARLAQCESGGRPDVVSSNGLYHGLYQFSVSTWQSVGGTGLPSQASPAEQTERAKILQARSGWGQWPACSRKLGLR